VKSREEAMILKCRWLSREDAAGRVSLRRASTLLGMKPVEGATAVLSV
jgi:hypothetical protein